jgi:hypothetical protein
MSDWVMVNLPFFEQILHVLNYEAEEFQTELVAFLKTLESKETKLVSGPELYYKDKTVSHFRVCVATRTQQLHISMQLTEFHKQFLLKRGTRLALPTFVNLSERFTNINPNYQSLLGLRMGYGEWSKPTAEFDSKHCLFEIEKKKFTEQFPNVLIVEK